ncbi:endothelin-converting enzyme 2 [Tribolium castaneum]|uniref:Endothelin-converting enzyme 2-like Protein n=1 Tax=Tribolium castaneum TaxID=7070 RepID=D6WV10_TRICA|nr:PREDICTED: endothelin-converting enzyme 2 [Tribolium castaneum]EFA08521.1 Endothelin-converting enzyme 2-like Protein [Tribolium castaneum]|eukprot:XP_008196206.1 PREDICTED: endothelin-converting enzyme 2 [Tribolium castaneum]
MLAKSLLVFATLVLIIDVRNASKLPLFPKTRNYSDESISPCSNFYAYACNTWTKQAKKPTFEPVWNPWMAVNHKIKRRLSQILTRHDSFLTQPQFFYRSCLNTKDHLNELKTFIDNLGGWSLIANKRDDNEWFQQLAVVTRILGIHPILKIHVDLDYKDPKSYAIYVEPGNLIFPEYILTGFEYKTELEAYEKWIYETVNHLSGGKKRINKDQIREIIKFEMYLATARNNDARNERTTVEKLSQKFSIDWIKFLDYIFGSFSIIAPNTTVIVKNYNYLKKLFLLVSQVGNRVARNYLMWSVIKDLSRDTDRYLRNLNFLIDQAILGVQEDLSREFECLDKVIAHFSPLLVPKYLKLFVNPRIFPDVKSMVESIKSEFVQILLQCDWLSNEGKSVLVEKIKNIKLHLGYPSWNFHALKRHYGKVKMTDNHFINTLALKQFKTSHSLARLAEQKPQTLWPSSPFDVNAYYSVLQNSIFIPLGMLEAPFYQYKREEISNFGALGSLIGHEISHSLDPAGILADPSGKIRKWLPDRDLKLYKNRISCFNGSHTIGETIADSNGLKISINAFKKRSPGRKNGQFFISFAQVWCEISEDTDIFTGDEHAPVSQRIQHILSNEDFQKTFNCGAKTSCDLW